MRSRIGVRARIYLALGLLFAWMPIGAVAAAGDTVVPLPGWHDGAAFSAAACGGGLGFVTGASDRIRFVLGRRTLDLPLVRGARPVAIVRGPKARCYALEAGAGAVAVANAGRILTTLTLPPPYVRGATLGPIAGTSSSIAYALPDVQTLVVWSPPGDDRVLGTAFGDVWKAPSGWILQPPMAPAAAPTARSGGVGAPDFVPPIPYDGPLFAAPDGSFWLIRYGEEPAYTSLVRYSARLHRFSVFPLVQIGIGALEPTDLAFLPDGGVAFVSQSPRGLAYVRLSPFGEAQVTIVGPPFRGIASRFGFVGNTIARDAWGRMWILDPDRARIAVVVGGTVRCAGGIGAKPAAIIAFSSEKFGVLDAAQREARLFDPRSVRLRACPSLRT